MTHDAGVEDKPVSESRLLEPIKIGSVEVANRAVVAPMSRVSTAGDGVPTESMAEYYREYADGGFGLIVAEGTYTDTLYAQAYPGQPAIVTDEQVRAWRNVVEGVHQVGVPIVLQLMHAGPLVQVNTHRDGCIGPSAVRPVGRMLRGYGGNQGSYLVPREMNDEDIEDVLAGIGTSAQRAEEAGFDGVEIHAANGYLFDQFMTRYANLREDRYGGSPENRARLAADAVRRARKCTGPNFIVGIRISQAKVNDVTYRWQDVSEATALMQTISAAEPSYVHVASEGVSWAETSYLTPSVTTTGLARDVFGVPVIANGGLGDPRTAAQLLDEGHADLISLGESALANPDWPKRVANGSKMRAFDKDMLSPEVTVENTQRWRRQNPEQWSAT
jgi:2,4-dienoyl-CoA reductase-like NADH-dependent reductase (Old Yellow Enzyme family)